MVGLAVLGILREALGVPPRNPRLVATVLLLLLPCNLLVLVVPMLTLRLGGNVHHPLVNRLPRQPSSRESPGVLAESGGPPAKVPRSINFRITVDPLRYVARHLSTLALVYLSAVACKGRHTTLGALLSKVRRSWRKIVVSFLYSQLFVSTYACFIFILSAALNYLVLESLTLVLFLIVLALFSTLCVSFLILLYLDVACRVSLVVSAVEEDKCGMAALAKAVSLTRARKLHGLVLLALCYALRQFTRTGYEKMGDEKQTQVASLVVVVRQFAHVLVNLSVRLLGWLVWTVYYYECKKTHGLMRKEVRLMGKEGRIEGTQSLVRMPCSVEGDLI